MLGELELLALQLPAVVQPEDPDRAEIIALRGSAAASRRRVTWGAGRRGGHHPQPVPGGVLDQDGDDVPGGVGVECR